MHEREYLLRWLDAAAARLRFDHLAHTAAALAAVACGALLLHRLIALAVPVDAVRSALLPLLIMIAFAGSCAVLWRARRTPDANDAAHAADRRAQLHDQLRSARWFADRAQTTPQIDLLLQRASNSAHAHSVAEAFPRRVPNALWWALAFLALSALLAQWHPPGRTVDATAQATAASQAAGTQQSLEAQQPAKGSEPAAPSAMAGEAQRLWSQLKALTEALPGADGALKSAVEARDATRAKRLLEALRIEAQPGGSTPPPAKDQVSAEVARGILDRLAQLMAEGGANGAPEAVAQQPNTGRITQALREEMYEAPPPEANAEQPEMSALDAELRAMSRQNYGPRQTGPGNGEAGAESGPSNSSGGAMGRRVGVSRAGAKDGEQDPDGNPTGTAEAEPVLGAPTQRLATQLKRVQVPSEPADEDEGSEESYFAATRSQSAQAQYVAARVAQRRSEETAALGGELPLDYREAAKRFTLAQHVKEAAARKREQAAAPR